MTSPIDGLLLAAEIIERGAGEIGDNRAHFERSRYSISSIDSEYDYGLRPTMYKSLTAGYKRTVKSRETHNLLEKNRRAQLKSCFSSLQAALPSKVDQKLSTVAILEQAAEHIVQLRTVHYSVLQDLELQRQHRQQLVSALEEKGVYVRLPEDRPLGPRPGAKRYYSHSDAVSLEQMEGVDGVSDRRLHRFSICEEPEMDEDYWDNTNFEHRNSTEEEFCNQTSPITIPAAQPQENTRYALISSSATTPSLTMENTFSSRSWSGSKSQSPQMEEAIKEEVSVRKDDQNYHRNDHGTVSVKSEGDYFIPTDMAEA
ncbi:hypothetical protein SARC_00650 [Sphaeroforma arctica JP610]|uniref:BHLH domain-containing protein n=1 Tax=Sphaeroforma arctica JP610 TaxID=667725 RepID=A0A0L0GE89_9EUKA|nr:hypothetical protein SARC_00650 [Sphaeroforma arctica JP610]KNC87214.1 hypothetical protein SARC_00650 [Sphaeroforma arctica JP610]|eukprot:XP_014161116.1 hypothetical protein SARC_00650 [Sphaeroforma arctica JP610]